MSATDTHLNDNPTRRLISEAIASGATNVQIDINPAFSALQTVLIGGSAGRLSVEFQASDANLQGGGVVSGGTIASMLDSAMAIGVMSVIDEGRSCATISLTVNMLKAGSPGHFLCETQVDQSGRRMAFASANLFDPAGTLIATGSSCLAII